MATISIYIPDSSADRVFDAIAANYRYQQTVPNPEGEGTIPNPESKAAFANAILRGFLAEHTRVYELEQARKAAEIAANGIGNITVDDGTNATPYEYDMVCLAAAKEQFDGLANIIAPGNSFSIPLSANGQAPATHYGSEVAVTETARQQLVVLELSGGTQLGGVQTLFYTRCTPDTDIAVSTNIPNYDIIGKPCSFNGVISHLGLKIIPE
jgi:hypothetical protein